MATVVENNPQIAAVLEIVQQRCREAVASNRAGKIRFSDLPYFSKSLGKWPEPALSPDLDLTKLSGKP